MSFRLPPVVCSMLLVLTTVAASQGVTGCGTGTALAPSSAPLTVPSFQGRAYGGQQPVYGAVIDILAAGTTGTYGTNAATILTGSTPVKTAADGSFNIKGNFSCPSSDAQIYMTATGGDPTGLDDGSVNNTAIKLVAALGPCGNLSTSSFTSLNEVTTVAAAFGLGQFFGGFGTTSDFIGAPSTNIVGLKNAFATAHNLASTTTGIVAPTAAASGTNYFLTTNDQAKINSMGNILADCVNQTVATATQCGTLFTAVTPSHPPLSTTGTATAPTDVFQAAVYMSLNPTSTNSASSSTNMTTLIGLQSAFMPFATNALSGAPTDWTLAVNYSDPSITQLSSAAVDANGDLWFSNQGTSTGAFVMLNGGTGTVGGTAGTTGGLVGAYKTLGTVAVNQPRQVAIDLNGKAWLADNTVDATNGGYYVLRATGGSGIDAVYPAGTTAGSLYAVAVDPSDNIIVSTSTDNVVSLSATSTSGISATITGNAEGNASQSGEHSGATGLAITSTSLAYAPENGGAYVFEFATNPVAASSGNVTQASAQFYGSALDGSGVLWIAENTSKLYTLSGTTFTQKVSGGCLSGPRYIAVDGNNNLWVSQNVSSGAVCEYSNSGTLLSSSAGYSSHGVTLARGIAIDQAGNVWVTSYPNATNSVTEIVGAAVPAVGPLVSAMKNSSIGKRP